MEGSVRALARSAMDRHASIVGSASIIVAMILWFTGIATVSTREFTDLGLVPALPFQSWAALFVLLGGFLYTLLGTKAPRTLLLITQTLVLITFVYGVPAMIEDGPRLNAAWRHIGIVEHIAEYGAIDSEIDAYFNWPGFFVLVAFMAGITGVDDLLTVAQWAPIALNIAYLGPLMLIARAASPDVRVIWLTPWTFTFTNWVGQDYFSPQGFSYLLWLMVMAISLQWFVGMGGDLSSRSTAAQSRLSLYRALPARLQPWIRPRNPMEFISPQRRLMLLGILILFFMVINGSHQLTPFVTLSGIALLVVFNQFTVRWLPLLMTVLIGLWIIFMAGDFWAGHGNSILEGLGRLGGAVGDSTTARIRGSEGHLFIVRWRILFTLVVWSLAAVGAWRRLRAGHRDLPLVILATAPFPLLLLQSYGGEMLLRVYFFTLPFAAFFIAALPFPRLTSPGNRTKGILIALLGILLLGNMLLTRYGNERMEHFHPAEVAAAEIMYESIDAPTTIVTLNWNAPIRYRDYASHVYVSLLDEMPEDGWHGVRGTSSDATSILATIDAIEGDGPVYIYLSRSQDAANELLGLTPVTYEDVVEALLDSERVRVIIRNEYAMVLLLVPVASSSTP